MLMFISVYPLESMSFLFCFSYFKSVNYTCPVSIVKFNYINIIYQSYNYKIHVLWQYQLKQLNLLDILAFSCCGSVVKQRMLRSHSAKKRPTAEVIQTAHTLVKLQISLGQAGSRLSSLPNSPSASRIKRHQS